MKIFNSIKAKTAAALLILGLIFVGVFLSTVWTINSQKSDSLVVNIAGRQRMLSQKVTKELMTYLSAQSAKINKETIQHSITLFDLSINALSDGGETFTDLQMTHPVILPPASTEAIKGELEIVKNLWIPFREKLNAAVETNGSNQLDIEYLIDTNTKILAAMHKTVGMMQADSEAKVSRLIVIQTTGFFFIVVIGVLFFMTIMRKMVRPVAHMATKFEMVSEGNLTVNVNVSGSDEISLLGASFNKIVQNLSQIIRKVQNSSHQVLNSTGEISSSSEDLAIRTNEEAASITETSTTLEKLTAHVNQNRENSQSASSALEEFNMNINEKSQLMSNVTETMQEIHDAGKKIGSIVTVINDISFQTNLLALNAAVEAARAGEAGRGFAVVASEVRNLAQKTAESSKNIQEIVSRNVISTQRGLELITQTSEFFTSIIEMMQDTVNNIQQITGASKEQATGVEQINIAVDQLETVITQNAALVEKLASAAKSMTANSQELQDLVDQFTI